MFLPPPRTIASSMIACKQVQPILHIPPAGSPGLSCRKTKEKVVIIMGATGTGKSRLSIDLATRYPAEIINSDKMQVYEGLDITTNKITEEESRGVLHHLLGIIDPDSEFTPSNFCSMASMAMTSILGRDQLPIVVGGSNSFVEALVNDKFQINYDCCFLWVDVAMPVLHQFVSDRVDRMVATGLVDEVREMFDLSNTDYSRGIRRAIGVPEFDHYFRAEHSNSDERARAILRLDATHVFLKNGRDADKAWEELVAGPSSLILNQFLYDFGARDYTSGAIREVSRGKAIAAASY